MIEKKVEPYEFLARWTDGKLTGAHVKFLTTIVEDGKIINQQDSDAQPVDIGQGQGFPLADILDQLHIDAITQMDTAVAAQKATDEQNTKVMEALDSAMSALQAAKANYATPADSVAAPAVAA